MARSGDVRVVWREAQQKWAVEVAGSTRARLLSDTRQAADEAAQRIAKRNQSARIVEDQHGGADDDHPRHLPRRPHE